MIHCLAGEGATFSIDGVTIGRNFHWERQASQIFEGNLTLVAEANGTLTAINTLSLESYLASVISSEMSSSAPAEFLKAQAVTSRSWLMAMLEKKKKLSVARPFFMTTPEKGDEIIRWYDRGDHEHFDVCADDHCQRYQGVAVKEHAAEAVTSTKGLCLAWMGRVCDARFHKACGGLTDHFDVAWEDIKVPYLHSISDGPKEFNRIENEEAARQWFLSRPDAYCHVTDTDFLKRILPAYDFETGDFFRWRVKYGQRELKEILFSKSGIDFGTIQELIPLARGPSGRIYQLKIVGSEKTMVLGKELEIRRWLSPSHLYSSAFIVHTEGGTVEMPERFVLTGGGWGHGIGLCQIGAAVMAEQGFSAQMILAHYFPGTSLERYYL